VYKNVVETCRNNKISFTKWDIRSMMKISYFRMCGCGGDGMEVKERIIRLIEQIDDSTVLRRIIYLCVPGMALI